MSEDQTHRSQTTHDRIFTVYDGNCYWSMPDGSHRCITADDARLINEALQGLDPDAAYNRERDAYDAYIDRRMGWDR